MSAFPKYDHYKDSGIEWLGDIPEGWEMKRSKRVFSQRKELARPGDEQLSATQAYGVIPQSVYESKVRRKIVRISLHLEKRKHVELDDFVISMRSFQGGLERAWSTGCIRSSYTILKPEVQIAPGYFTHFFKCPQYIRALQSTGNFIRDGQDLNYDNFIAVDLPYPPIEEQTRIGTFLDRKTAEIDALIAKKQRQIELLDEQKAILINRAVTRGLSAVASAKEGLNPKAKLKPSGIEWIGEIPEHWTVKRLRYLCTLGTGERDTKNSVARGEFPFFVRSQTPERINSFGFDCEAVLTAGDGAGVGKVFHHFVGRFDAHQRVYVMRDFVDVLGRYFFLFLRENFHRVALTGEAKSTVDSLRRPMLADFQVPFPSEEEQRAIIDHCDEISRQIAELHRITTTEIKSLKTLRSTLIAHAVTGRIKV
jgi:type I restriction enzyme, S subunit